MERSLMCIFVAHAPENWTACNILASSTQIPQIPQKTRFLWNLWNLCTALFIAHRFAHGGDDGVGDSLLEQFVELAG